MSSLFNDLEFALVDDTLNVYLISEADLTNDNRVVKMAIAQLYKFVNTLELTRRNFVFMLLDSPAIKSLVMQE
jgi:hypothetical protein